MKIKCPPPPTKADEPLAELMERLDTALSLSSDFFLLWWVRTTARYLFLKRTLSLLIVFWIVAESFSPPGGSLAKLPNVSTTNILDLVRANILSANSIVSSQVRM